ncbi:hypothetical protein ABTX35_24030 [Streptomyces sp. NPDC096080]|uniref:hypothetical protein n=1 Tax=Streptomyces sp. NPDC096080 TaxID=3156693 RepID=UPI00331BF01C
MTGIVEAARAAWYAHEARTPDWDAAEFAHTRDEFVQAAAEHAEEVLGAPAATLTWSYTPSSRLPESVEQATALLEDDDRLQYRVDHSQGGCVYFELVRACAKCARTQVDPVDGMVTLGRLLAEKGEAA